MVDSFFLFTVLALIVAVIQILPKSDVIESRAYPDRFFKGLLFALVLLIISLMVMGAFFEYVASLEKSAAEDPLNKSFVLDNPVITAVSHINDSPDLSTPSLDFFIQGVSVILLLFSASIYFRRKDKVGDAPAFLEDLDELYFQGNYSSFYKLFDSHYDFLLMVPPTKIIPATEWDRIKQRIREFKDRTITFFTEEEDQHFEINQDVLAFVRGKFSDSNFIEKLALIKPSLGVRISFDDRVDRDLRQMLIFEFYRVLLKRPDSILHRELSESMELRLDDRHRYKIPQDSQIISAIFENLGQIQDLDIIKAFGETTIELINIHYEKQRGQQRRPGIDTFNDREVNPIITGLRFFDLIVTEALYQKIPWHMWLYYHTHFVRAICAQFPDLDVDESYARDDLPEIRYLHEIVYNLIHWIEIADDDPDRIDLKINNYYCGHENGSIIKSSIICLSQCIDTIIRTEKIPDLLKGELVHAYLGTSFELRGSENLVSRELGCTMARCFVLEGGIDRDPEMKQTLHSLITSYDTPKLTGNPRGSRLFDELKRKSDPMENYSQ